MFAPTDGAFAVLGQTLNSLTNAQLRRLLYYHVTGGFVLASAIMAPTNYTSLLGENLLVSRVNNVSIILKFFLVPQGNCSSKDRNNEESSFSNAKTRNIIIIEFIAL